jgi:Uri superfamily endonuclease
MVRPGHYVYVGSAFGPGGVRARVERHARGDGATHWHVDYLRAVTSLEQAWGTHDDTRRECDWAATMRALPGAAIPIRGFGASDCDCPTHLYRFDAPPSLEAFREHLRARHPAHDPVHRVWGTAPGRYRQ